MSSSPLMAIALPASRAAVGMVMVLAAAEVRTRPPAVVKVAAVMGSRVGAGAERTMEARQKRNRPWGETVQWRI